jgi:hypothetical protein
LVTAVVESREQGNPYAFESGCVVVEGALRDVLEGRSIKHPI